MADAKQVAAGLTKAQRAAILAFNGKRYASPKLIGVSSATAYSLWNRPLGPNLEAPQVLLSRDYADWPRLHYTYKLTALGLEVRAILEQENRNEQ